MLSASVLLWKLIAVVGGPTIAEAGNGILNLPFNTTYLQGTIDWSTPLLSTGIKSFFDHDTPPSYNTNSKIVLYDGTIVDLDGSGQPADCASTVGNRACGYYYPARNMWVYYDGHDGIDFRIPSNTPVLAAAPGTVSVVDTNNCGFGQMVKIDHGNGYSTLYGHLSSISVYQGQPNIHAGDPIGRSGSSVGSCGTSTAAHLHFGVYDSSGNPVDPFGFGCSAWLWAVRTPCPGGVWISPLNPTTTLTTQTVHYSVHAYPQPGDPPVHHVMFTLWYPALNVPESGPWAIACYKSAPDPGTTDQYSCDFPLTDVPGGTVKVGFDVYDTAEHVNFSPNGVHVINYYPPSTNLPTCASTAGMQCLASGGVVGTWTKTGSGTFNYDATGPSNALVGSTPTLFLPTTAGVEVPVGACGPVSTARTTSCRGSTSGDLLQATTIAVQFATTDGRQQGITGAVSQVSPVPAPPGNVVAQATSCSQVTISWSYSWPYRSGGEGFNLYRNGEIVARVGTDTLATADPFSEAQNTTLSFYVTAVRGTAESSPSNTVSVTTPSCSLDARFWLSPQLGTYRAGDVFAVTVNIDSGSASSVGAYSFYVFDPNILQIDSVDDGLWFNNPASFRWGVYPNNTVYILQVGGSVAPQHGSGAFAIIHFRAVASGTSTVSLDCGQGKIWVELQQANALNCGLSQGGSYQVTGVPSLTPTRTSTPTTGGRPANDNVAGAIGVYSLPAMFTVDTTNATVEPGEYTVWDGYPCNISIGKTIWYRIALSTTTAVTISTSGSTFNVGVAEFSSADPVNGLLQPPDNCNNDANGILRSSMSFTAVGGVTYAIQVGGINASGGTLVIGFSSGPPATGTPTPTPTNRPATSTATLIPTATIPPGTVPLHFVSARLTNGNGVETGAFVPGDYLEVIFDATVDYPTALSGSLRCQVTGSDGRTAARLSTNLSSYSWSGGHGNQQYVVCQKQLLATDVSGTYQMRVFATAPGTSYGGGAGWSFSISPIVCTPRPRIHISTTPLGGGQLRVSVSVEGGNNQIQNIQFLSRDGHVANTNALIDVGGQLGRTGDFQWSPSAATSQTSFVVRRAVSGQGVTLPIVISDGCGAWPSVIGGGSGAF